MVRGKQSFLRRLGAGCFENVLNVDFLYWQAGALSKAVSRPGPRDAAVLPSVLNFFGGDQVLSFFAQVEEVVPVKAMPCWPKEMDPIAAEQLRGLKGEALRVGLEEYQRAVSNRMPKARPAQKAEAQTVSRNKKSMVVDLETPAPVDREAGPKKEKPPQQPPETMAPPAEPCAPPPTKPAVPKPAGSRPARRPFPPPRGFRWGNIVSSTNHFFPQCALQGI